MRVDKMHQKSFKVPETSELHDAYTRQDITVAYIWWVSFSSFLFFLRGGGEMVRRGDPLVLRCD